MTDDQDPKNQSDQGDKPAATVYIRYSKTGEMLGAKLVGRGVPPRGYARYEVTADGEVRRAK